MAVHTRNGKAFEWSIALSLSDMAQVEITESLAATKARESFEEIDTKLRDRFVSASNLAVHHILSLEKNRSAVVEARSVSLSKDSDGKGKGLDLPAVVSDVFLVGGSDKLGISCKSNSDAYKHSRLSGSIDFVKKWGISESGASPEYWASVGPVFEELARIRQDGPGTPYFKNFPAKNDRFVLPVLNAWAEELKRQFASMSAEGKRLATERLVSYLIGKDDFYKVICRIRPRQEVEIQGINLHSQLATPKTPMPTDFLQVQKLYPKKPLTRTVQLNHGMGFNFRLHTASSKVEPSLKFDITPESLPPSLVYTNHMLF